ncbi:hypothetical protein B0H10DRAFT_2240437 [Mycena sp. CBHHK59/15]|nr:hypothetical protein B0H10DRAFT_2240437 [Mycena sp. CBHHK59/15]
MSDVAIFVSDSSHLASSTSTAHLGLTCVPACTWARARADECGPADFPFASPALPCRSSRVAHLRRGHLHPRCALEAEALDDVGGGWQRLIAQEMWPPWRCWTPLHRLRLARPGRARPGEDPSKRACTEDVELKMAGFRRFTDDKTDAI